MTYFITKKYIVSVVRVAAPHKKEVCITVAVFEVDQNWIQLDIINFIPITSCCMYNRTIAKSIQNEQHFMVVDACVVDIENIIAESFKINNNK